MKHLPCIKQYVLR